MKRPTFELKEAVGNRKFRILIPTDQSFDEEEMVSEITPIFHCLNPSLDEATGNLRSGLCLSPCFETGPKWIISEPDAEGICYRMGITVHPRLLDEMITEMSLIGYQIIQDI